jgi:hypothetical protein
MPFQSAARSRRRRPPQLRSPLPSALLCTVGRRPCPALGGPDRHAGVRHPDPRDGAPIRLPIPIRAGSSHRRFDHGHRRSGPGGARACGRRRSGTVDAQ